MKIRQDFVTNSSSSSFILARKEKLTEKQKEAIIEFVENEFFGRQVLTPDSTEEEIQEVFDENYINEDKQEEIRRALKEGKSIYGGWVSFEESDWEIANIYTSLWEKLEEVDKDSFETIDGDLDY